MPLDITLPRPVLASLLLVLGSACGAETETSEKPPRKAQVLELPGPHPVGNATFVVSDTARQRDLRVELWYPAAEMARAAADAGEDISAFVAEGADRDTFAGYLATAPDPGTSRRTHAARDAAPADGGPFPLVVMSHCFNCTRFSTFTIAERLASHGFGVVAPDHTKGTLFDGFADDGGKLGGEFLIVRKDDLAFVLDRVLDASATELPAALRGRWDATRVGALGHSFGAVTAGLLAMTDPRIKSGFALAAPIDNPLVPGVKIADVHVPYFFWLAMEDNSITELGNTLIRSNFASAQSPAWKAEVADIGHWSVSDICGIIPDFDAGCTTADARQTTAEPFTYHDIVETRGIAASYVAAFFLATLNGDAEASAYLGKGAPASLVTIESK